MLSRFWLLVEGGGAGGHALSEFVKNKICYKNLFSDNAEWSFKNLWKMMTADVKANKEQIKDLVAVSYKFL